LELGKEICLGTNGSVITARDRISKIEGIKCESVDLLLIGVARNLTGNVLGPSKDLIAKWFGSSRLELNLVNVEAEPEDFLKGRL